MAGATTGALGGALAGAVIGAAQWLVLRRYLRVGPEWILATALGVGIGDSFGALLTGAGRGLGALLITGLASGVAVGLLQWGLFLRGRLLVASLWLPVVAIAWLLGWTVTWADGVDVERGYAVFGASGALVFAAVTGLAMLPCSAAGLASLERGTGATNQGGEEKQRMTDNGELNVVFGTGAVGMFVMDELIRKGPRWVRMVNRSGLARVPHGVEVTVMEEYL